MDVRRRRSELICGSHESHANQGVSCFRLRCGLSSLSSSNRSVSDCVDTRTTTSLLGVQSCGLTVRRIPANPGDHRCRGNGGTSAFSASAECPGPPRRLDHGGSERKSVTETDLITAGGSDENVELPQTQPVNSDKSSSQGDSAADATNGTSTAATAPSAWPTGRSAARDEGARRGRPGRPGIPGTA